MTNPQTSTLPWVLLIGTWLLLIIWKFGWVHFFSAYFAEKGKRFATSEDIEKVLEEVRRVTTETERIRAQISGELWSRQAHWNEKREIYASLLGISGEMQGEFVKIHSMHAGVTVLPPRDFEVPFDRLMVLAADFRKAAALALIFANKGANDAVDQYIEFGVTTGTAAARAAEAIYALEELRKGLIRAAKQDLFGEADVEVGQTVGPVRAGAEVTADGTMQGALDAPKRRLRKAE